MCALADHARAILIAIGEDPDRDGLRETPARFARWWNEFVDHKQARLHTTFDSTQTDQMVVVRDMRVWSLCEHHLLPFWCDVSIGVIPGSKILGLSKFARIANKCAHRLQVQERLIEQIGEAVRAACGTFDVAVVGEGQHLCMTMRGVKTPSTMVCSSCHGKFRDDPATRAEFFALLGRRP